MFSDKTGTLTRNVMQFKTCSIGGCLFAGKFVVFYCSCIIYHFYDRMGGGKVFQFLQ